MRRQLIILLMLFQVLTMWSQNRRRTFRQHEVGVFGGGSYYLGDLNPRTHFVFSKPATGVYYRFTPSYRFAFKFGFNYGQLFADDALSGEADQIERNLNFRTRIYEWYGVSEFHFVEYRIGHDRHKFSFYVFGGLGYFIFNPQGNYNGNYTDLSGLSTEGQSYKKRQMNIPFGCGIKWNMGKSFGMALEWGPRKLYTDYLDDVSGKYPETAISDNGSTFSNRSGESVAGGMRGNPSTRDWYFFYGLNITYKFPDKGSCHGTGRRRKPLFPNHFHHSTIFGSRS